MLLFCESRAILTSVILSQYTRVLDDDDRRQTDRGQHSMTIAEHFAMKLQRSAKIGYLSALLACATKIAIIIYNDST